MPLNVFTLLGSIYQELHATGPSDAIWFTDAELTRLLNDRFRHVCQNTAVNVVRDTASIILATGVSTYALPPDHLSTIAVALDNRPLKPASTFELEHRDPILARQASTNNPVTWWYEDKIGVGNIGFYPVPDANVNGHAVEIIFHKLECSLDEAHTVTSVNLPAAFGDWAVYQTASEAYRVESDIRAVDIADAMTGFAELYMSVFREYYSPAAQ